MTQTIIDISLFPVTLFFVGLGLSRLLVPLSGWLAVLLGAVDRPNARKVHTRVMPRMGGIAIAAALFATLLLGIQLESRIVASLLSCVQLEHQAMQAFLLGALVVVVVGTLDDTIGIRPWLKFAGEILAALVFIEVGGFSLTSFGNLLGFGEIRTGWLAVPLTIFCMVGLMNALNLSDGLDGLAGGISFIVVLFLATLAHGAQAQIWTILSLALLGVLLGFLRHNHHPASLFMGDSGSLLLGYSLGAITVGLTMSIDGSRPIKPITLAVILALPIVDTVYVMGRRLLTGRNPFQPDKTHLHHRLLAMGLYQQGVVNIYYLLMLIFAFAAWYARGWPEWLRFYGGLACLVSFYVGLARMEGRRLDLGRWLDSLRLFRHRRFSLPVWFPAWLERTGVLLLALLLLAALLGLGQVPETLGFLALATALFIALLFPWSGKRKRLPLGHGVLYLACFSLLVLPLSMPGKPPWIVPVLYGAAGFAFVAVLLLVAGSRRSLMLYPCGFEILLLLVSWACPLLVLPILGASEQVQAATATACVLALPLFCFGKLVLGRRPAANIGAALAFLLLFLLLGAPAFL